MYIFFKYKKAKVISYNTAWVLYDNIILGTPWFDRSIDSYGSTHDAGVEILTGLLTIPS